MIGIVKKIVYFMRLPWYYYITYVTVIAVGIIFFAGVNYIPSHITISCPIKSLTGILCPSCGITTSVLLALHGHLLAAIKAHPFGPFVIIGMATAIILSAYGLVKRSKLEWLFNKYLTTIAIVGILLYLLVWLLRLWTL